MIQLKLNAQCPANIGFENGDFTNWVCYAGLVDAQGIINVQPTLPIAGRHTILQNSFPQQKDLYGGFPVNCPNGSNYSIKLGDESAQKHAERVSYEFTIPVNQSVFSIIYNYAVVFENPNHQDFEQPKFTANVFDVSAGKYINCPSFSFVASGNLPGFQQSSKGQNVFYKPWSPVSIKLVGYAGKTIRLEFTTNACTKGGHFGYAYLDVNENCTSPIEGNVYCNGAEQITLTAPFGFKEYKWFDAGFTNVIGTTNTLTLKPPPPAGTVFALELIPYDGYGCLDTVYTTITESPDAFRFALQDTAISCATFGADLTRTKYITGSTPGLKFSYFLDNLGLNYIPTPKNVTSQGTYYIKAENAAGCNEIKPISVFIKPVPNLSAKTNSVLVCLPDKFDLTDLNLLNGASSAYQYSYWKDIDATKPVPLPQQIDVSGVYYILAKDPEGCTSIINIAATIVAPYIFSANDQTSCGFVDLTASKVTNTNPGEFLFEYYEDAATTQLVTNAKRIQSSGTYYIKGNGVNGCNVIHPVRVIVNPNPLLQATSPQPVTFPQTVDITKTFIPVNGVRYSYWYDAALTRPVIMPYAVDTTIKLYIKATDNIGCFTVDSVKAVVKEPTITPPNAFSPNGDGINDTWEIQYLQTRFADCTIDVFNRYGQIVYHSTGYAKPWDGSMKNQKLPFGTYYYVIKLNKTGDIVSGSVSLLP